MIRSAAVVEAAADAAVLGIDPRAILDADHPADLAVWAHVLERASVRRGELEADVARYAGEVAGARVSEALRPALRQIAAVVVRAIRSTR